MSILIWWIDVQFRARENFSHMATSLMRWRAANIFFIIFDSLRHIQALSVIDQGGILIVLHIQSHCMNFCGLIWECLKLQDVCKRVQSKILWQTYIVNLTYFKGFSPKSLCIKSLYNKIKCYNAQKI